MQIVCPACHALYEVPEAALAAAPRVKCARCTQEWAPLARKAPAPTPAIPAETPPVVTPPRPAFLDPGSLAGSDRAGKPPHHTKLAADGDPSASVTGALLAWAASLILLAGLGWASYNWRGEVMHAWPASTRVYAALGLGAPSM